MVRRKGKASVGKGKRKARSARAKARKRSVSKTARSSQAVARIDARFKGLIQAAEPPLDKDPSHLLPTFRQRLEAALAHLAQAKTPFKLVEGYRTLDRQQWLYGSGRPKAQPYGRPGPILTNADGVSVMSKHQGDGSPGTGLAADCYPTRNGQVYIPPSSDPVWESYASAVEAQGLIAGHHWPTLKDSPHCENP
jgi:hypothetical protein